MNPIYRDLKESYSILFIYYSFYFNFYYKIYDLLDFIALINY